MTRTTLPIAVALAASAGLLLTACGGSGSDSSDKIPSSSAPATSATATATPSATQAGGPAAPTFALPPDMKVNFKGFTSSDAKKQAALTDTTYAATAILEFEAKTYTKEPPNFKRFWAGATGAAYADEIIKEGKDGNVITGTYNYYKPVLTTMSTGNVAVQYCEDQRKGYLKDPRTGHVFTTTPSLKDFRLWNLSLSKGPNGDWQVYQYHWTKGAKSCEL